MRINAWLRTILFSVLAFGLLKILIFSYQFFVSAQLLEEHMAAAQDPNQSPEIIERILFQNRYHTASAPTMNDISNTELLTDPKAAQAYTAMRHMQQGQYLKAKPLYQKLLQAYEQSNADTITLLSALQPLAEIQQQLQAWPQAIKHYQRIVVLQQQQFGLKDQRVQKTLEHLQQLKSNQG